MGLDVYEKDGPNECVLNRISLPRMAAVDTSRGRNPLPDIANKKLNSNSTHLRAPYVLK